MAPKKSFGEGSKKRHKSRAQEDEPATMDSTFRSFEHSGMKLKGMKKQCMKDEEPLTVPPMAPSSSHVNEDNFQLMFGRMDSLATSMENLTTLITNRFSVYDANFTSLAQTLEDINERLGNNGM
uniref:Uncharacterized protein n=1 Tax=Fagus sylvatica TaxID=28930 RepID=A0A2N9IGT8_FAGSY